MAKQKTLPTESDVREFIKEFAPNEQRRKDALELLKFMENVSGHKPKMWGPSIVGFGSYHYKYASGREGDAPLVGFSPRKSALSLYVFTGLDKHEYLLNDLGKFKTGKSCIYVKNLSDIDLKVLENLMKETIHFLRKKYE